MRIHATVEDHSADAQDIYSSVKEEILACVHLSTLVHTLKKPWFFPESFKVYPAYEFSSILCLLL